MLRTACSVTQILTAHGHTAYLVGGYVRDSMMGVEFDDIDIATSAHPDVVKALFPSHHVGGRPGFVVIVVHHAGHMFDVATFREEGECIRLSTDPYHDAMCRDFTINGMFLDPSTGEVIDFVGGRRDMGLKIVRCIGDPTKRFEEDTLRMLRAVRFAHRLSFDIEAHTKVAIVQVASRLMNEASSGERTWKELVKMHANGSFERALGSLHDLGLLRSIFPSLGRYKHAEIASRIESCARFPRGTGIYAYLCALLGECSSRTVPKDVPVHRHRRIVEASSQP